MHLGSLVERGVESISHRFRKSSSYCYAVSETERFEKNLAA